MSGETCLAVMYHYVRDTAATQFAHIRALPPALFEQQLDWLEQRYQLVTMAALEAALDGQFALPPNAAILTFDDGFIDHYDVAWPALRRRGLSGVFFLSLDACAPSPRVLAVHKIHFLLALLGPARFGREVLEACQAAAPATAGARSVFGADQWEHADERAIKDLLNYELPFEQAAAVLDQMFARHLGAEEAFARTLYVDARMIGEMADGGMTFGYHTRSHRMLSRLPVAAQEVELRDGVAWIRRLTGQRDVPFCYPWGGSGTYTDDTVALLERVGYSTAFNTVRRRIDVRSDRRYELPRVDTRDLPPYTAGEPGAAGEMENSEA